MKKQQMVLNKISEALPGQEKEFLEFMAKTVNSTIDYSEYTTEELVKGFITFEENEMDESLTPEIMDELLSIYIVGFEEGAF